MADERCFGTLDNAGEEESSPQKIESLPCIELRNVVRHQLRESRSNLKTGPGLLIIEINEM